MAKHFGGERLMTIGRAAILTQASSRPRGLPLLRSVRAAVASRSLIFSSLNSTLPAAQATGKLTLRPHSVVHSLIFRCGDAKVTGVRVIDGQTHAAIEFKRESRFSCARRRWSRRALCCNSTSTEFPNGLGNSSGQLGRNLMDHAMGGGATGEFPDNEDKMPQGRRPNGIYVPRFRNVKSKASAISCGATDFRAAATAKLGARPEIGRVRCRVQTFARAAGTVAIRLLRIWRVPAQPATIMFELDPEVKDAWGIPALSIHCAWRENERALFKDMSISAAEMLAAAGATDITPFIEDNPPGLTIHEMGTARMGKRSEDLGAERAQPGARREKSVCDRRRVHDVVVVRESVVDLHGLDRAGVRLRGSQMKKGEL